MFIAGLDNCDSNSGKFYKIIAAVMLMLQTETSKSFLHVALPMVSSLSNCMLLSFHSKCDVVLFFVYKKGQSLFSH